MEEEFKKYLPIGTVVMLKGGKKRMMIAGFLGISSDNKNTYDYIGCLYPEGIISMTSNLLFNHDEIEKIYGVGYSDEEDKHFRERIDGIKQKFNDKKNNPEERES